MNVYRCEWCGRFYASAAPEGSACPNHIPEHNKRLSEQIARHNERLREQPHWGGYPLTWGDEG